MGMRDSLFLAAFTGLLTGWVGYITAGRRWRQSERRSVYREYLIAAHEMMEAFHAFEKAWNANPEEMPQLLYESLTEKKRALEAKAQDIRLISPMKVCNAADGLVLSVHDVMDEVVYLEDDDDYEMKSPPSYEWFHERRCELLQGPDHYELDEFINLARADLGAQSRFWRLRGESTSYRRGIPAWVKWTLLPTLPIIGKPYWRWLNRRFDERMRKSDQDWAARRHERQAQAKARALATHPGND